MTPFLCPALASAPDSFQNQTRTTKAPRTPAVGGAAPMEFVRDQATDPIATVLLAHGAGAPMRTEFMDAIAAALAHRRLDVARFEFAYMAARHQGQRKPPPRADRLMDEYRAAVEALRAGPPLIIGGKSMGGRVASMLADELYAAGRIAGLLCLGYPFHPPGKPEKLRTAHLEELKTPALICQGTRDALGSEQEVAGYRLSPAIEFCWLADGDHNLKPRKASGFTQAAHFATAAGRIAEWARGAQGRADRGRVGA